MVVVLDSCCFVEKENPVAAGGGIPNENAPAFFESVDGVVPGADADAPNANAAFPLEVVPDAGAATPNENGALPLEVAAVAGAGAVTPNENGAFPLEVVPAAGAPNENGAFPLELIPVAGAGAVVGAATPNVKIAEVPDEALFTLDDEDASASAS